MNALNSIKSKLKPLNLYNLDDENLINAELSAYAEGLDIVNEKLEELERESFISTANSYGISLREKLFNCNNSQLDLQKRREWLLFKCSVTSNDFTKGCLEKAINACGMKAQIFENTAENTFTISCLEITDSTATQEDIKNRVREFLPAHLTALFDFQKLDWNTVDQSDLSFDDMDSKDVSWDQVGTY